MSRSKANNSFMNRYVRTSTPEMSDVEPTVWSATPQAWSELPPAYATALMGQYQVYVEMADRIGARRALANTFFLTLNSLVVTLFGVMWEDPPGGDVWWLAFPLVALVGQCGAWYWLLRSYRQLSAAKYVVVGAIESRLPISPYWSAEWNALGEGTIPSRYLPLTHLEQWIPLLFAATYVAAFMAALLA